MSHQARIEQLERSRQYIEEHLDEKISLDKLAQVAYLSKYHYHRIFRAVYGEAVKSYIKRIRLENSARLLNYSQMSVHEIAIRTGYDSQSAFSTAFKKYFGMSPIDFRNTKSFISMEKQMPNTAPAIQLTPTLRQVPEKIILYKQIVGNYQSPQVAAAWMQLWQTIQQNGLMYDGLQTIGIGHDDPNITDPDNCRYDAAISLREKITPPEGFQVKMLAGGTYAVFPHKGPYEGLPQTYNAIFGQWLLNSEYQLREVQVYEVYLNAPMNTAPADLVTEIFVPVV